MIAKILIGRDQAFRRRTYSHARKKKRKQIHAWRSFAL